MAVVVPGVNGEVEVGKAVARREHDPARDDFRKTAQKQGERLFVCDDRGF